MTFCDSLSYISALLDKKKYDMDDLVSSMIRACRDLITLLGVSVPKHLYLHIEGTLLDDLLDVTDWEAKIGASLAAPTVGYLVGLQPPLAVGTRQGCQGHDPRSRIIPRSWRSAMGFSRSTRAPRVSCVTGVLNTVFRYRHARWCGFTGFIMHTT